MKKGSYVVEITVECCHTKICTMKCIKCPTFRHSEKVLDPKQKFKTIFSMNYILFVIYTEAHNCLCEFVGTGNNILHEKYIKKFAKHVERGKTKSHGTQKHNLALLNRSLWQQQS